MALIVAVAALLTYAVVEHGTTPVPAASTGKFPGSPSASPASPARSAPPGRQPRVHESGEEPCEHPHDGCNASAAAEFPRSAPVPPGTPLLTRAEVLAQVESEQGVIGIGAEEMTYGRAHRRFPDLAATSDNVEDYRRPVWVVTAYLDTPILDPTGGYGPAAYTPSPPFYRSTTSITDAATDVQTDAEVGPPLLPRQQWFRPQAR